MMSKVTDPVIWTVAMGTLKEKKGENQKLHEHPNLNIVLKIQLNHWGMKYKTYVSFGSWNFDSVNEYENENEILTQKCSRISFLFPLTVLEFYDSYL